jgi:hypothetical protein
MLLKLMFLKGGESFLLGGVYLCHIGRDYYTKWVELFLREKIFLRPKNILSDV